MEENFRKYLVEFIGTFFLVFTVGAVTLFGVSGIIAPVAIGFALMIMVYAGGHISGGHYNPAVSFSAFLSGALEKGKLLPYWIAQILGAIMAVFFIRSLTLEFVPDFSYLYSPEQLIIGEFLFTFALCYVVLNTAVSKANSDKGFYGLAIGSTVTVGALSVGGIICLGAFNPAVAFGLGLLKCSCWAYVGITVFANLIAAVMAAYTYRLISGTK